MTPGEEARAVAYEEMAGLITAGITAPVAFEAIMGRHAGNSRRGAASKTCSSIGGCGRRCHWRGERRRGKLSCPAPSQANSFGQTGGRTHASEPAR
jgi:hypothetical protein